jgi:hypothetical protein
MEARTIVGIVALVLVSVCGLIATFTSFEIVDKVNEKLPKGERFDWLGWYATKTIRLHREYKRNYPDGHLVFKVRTLTVFMFACVLISAWGFKFFAK